MPRILLIEFANALFPSGNTRHPLRVKSICMEIVENLSSTQKESINCSALQMAAILHDMGKRKHGNKKHHKVSASIVEKTFNCKRKQKNRDFAKLVKNIILSHKGSFKPKRKGAKEAAILRMADKIDRFGRKNDASKKYEDNIQKIESYFSLNDVAFFKDLKRACDKVKEIHV